MGRKIDNTAPRRDIDVRARDFKELKGKLTLDFNTQSKAPEKAAVRAWNSYIPLSPRTVFNMLTRDLPRGTTVKIDDFDETGHGNLSIECETPAGNELLSDSRDFHFGEREAGQGNVSVRHSKQGRGLGRRLMRNQIEFLHACRVKRFNIYAGLDNGGYTWARVGFLPRDVKSDSFRRHVIDKVESRLAMLRPLLDKATLEQTGRRLKFRRRADIWGLSDIETDLVPLLARAFEGAGRKAPLSESERRIIAYHFQADYNEAVRRGRPLPLGRVLLTGTSWEGTLDLDSRRQMKRVGAYCGGWKYISI